ncbi:MAG: carbon-nitrogen hydrolase family protein [Erysipelotrichia bacterium]|nr:carbon-nitrogen hydrolase family protein [Erysipelotrichia bacterium]
MRIFALELNNEIKGLEERKVYIESLIAKLPAPDLVLLPELAICSYLPNQKVWEYADHAGQDTAAWAFKLATKFNTFIGVGYVDYENGHYYNRYLIADKKEVYGVVTKSEGEAAVFKRGKYNNVIKTPFGNVGVAICYDSRRKHFYENIKNEKISLIVFPHGSPADPKKDLEETKTNAYFCNVHKEAFDVPIVYINSVGKLEHMPGIMGWLMKRFKFTMNGKTKIYSDRGVKIKNIIKEAEGYEIKLSSKKRKKDIFFYGNDLIKGNVFFRFFILRPDIFIGIKHYQKGLKRNAKYLK